MSEEFVRSPCISLCALDEQDICMGCYRSGEEIANWGRMSAAERKAVLHNTAQREQASFFYTPTAEVKKAP